MDKLMEEAHKLAEETEEEAKRVGQPLLKVISGGRDGTTDDPEWLTKLPLNTAFLIQDKTNAGFDLGQFQILKITPNGRGAFLYSGLGEKTVMFWVNCIRFCNKYTLFDIIHQGDGVEHVTQETEEEQSNG